VAHIRQSMPDSSLGFQGKVLCIFEGVPFLIGSGCVGQGRRRRGLAAGVLTFTPPKRYQLQGDDKVIEFSWSGASAVNPHPSPKTRNPVSEPRHSEPYTCNPRLNIRNPVPETRNSTSETRNLKLSTLNCHHPTNYEGSNTEFRAPGHKSQTLNPNP
jgi:hypothetical protein